MTYQSGSDNSVELSTTESVAGREIQSNLGLVVGSEKLGWGGTDNVEEKTQVAIERLTSAAENINADAVIGLRIGSVASESDDMYASIVCYGTAVKLKSE